MTTIDGAEVGKITKQWSGLAREMFTDADHFGISFPMDLDVKVKATLLGACFLIVSILRMIKVQIQLIDDNELVFIIPGCHVLRKVGKSRN